MVEPGTLITGAYRNPLLAAAVMTTLPVSMGGAVFATESGLGCELSADSVPWPQLLGNLVAGVSTILIIVLVLQVRRTQRGRPALARSATAVGLSFLVEIAVGTLILVLGASTLMLVIYVAAAVANWAYLTALAVLTGIARPSIQKHPLGYRE